MGAEPSKDGSGFAAVVSAGASDADDEALIAFADDTERGLLVAGCTPPEARRLATVRLVAQMLLDDAAEGHLRLESSIFSCASQVGGLPETELRILAGRHALRDPRTAALPPRGAIQVQLRVAATVAAITELSLWMADSTGHLAEVAEVDGSRPTQAVARAASRVFAESASTPPGPQRELVGVPIKRASTTVGALAGRTARGGAVMALMMLKAAAPAIGLLLERQQLLESADRQGDQAVRAAERALVRFGFDLHDGPAQGVAALQGDIRKLRAQVGDAFEDGPRTELLLGRLADLEARSKLLSDQIRGVARSARAPAALEEPVEDVVRGELVGLRGATGIEVELDVAGPVDTATPSQRIALLRGVQEALRNVREHSGARRVSVRIAAGSGSTEAEIRDDGRGFDAKRARAEAARGGHMGLAGIVERVRLIGGDCEIESRPGGPTSIRISVPRWGRGGRGGRQ
jgi:signal transduction histidine kinase